MKAEAIPLFLDNDPGNYKLKHMTYVGNL